MMKTIRIYHRKELVNLLRWQVALLKMKAQIVQHPFKTVLLGVWNDMTPHEIARGIRQHRILYGIYECF